MPQYTGRARHVVTAVVVAHDAARLLPGLINAVREQTHPVQRVIGVDTGSQDRSGATLTELLGQDAVFGMEPDTGYGAAVASALQHPAARAPAGGRSAGERPASGTEWIWLLHDDCEPAPDALEQLLAGAGRSRSAAVLGPKLKDLSDRRVVREAGITTDRAGRRLTGVEPGEIDQGQHDGSRAVLAVSSAGMLVRRDVWNQLGGFDANLPLFRDDIDFCWRAHAAGYEVRVITDAVVYHRELSARQIRKTPATGGHPRMLDRRSALYVFAVNLPLWPMLGVLTGCVAGSLVRAAWCLLTKQQRKAAAHLGAVAWLLRHPLLLLARASPPCRRPQARLRGAARPAAARPDAEPGLRGGGGHAVPRVGLRRRRPAPRHGGRGRRRPAAARHGLGCPAGAHQPGRPALRRPGRGRAGRGAVADRLGAVRIGHVRRRGAGARLQRGGQPVARVPGRLSRHGHRLGRQHPAVRRGAGRPGHAVRRQAVAGHGRATARLRAAGRDDRVPRRPAADLRCWARGSGSRPATRCSRWPPEPWRPAGSAPWSPSCCSR